MSPSAVRVTAAGVASVVGTYAARDARSIPAGFAKVCEQMQWDTKGTWEQLSDLKLPWFEAANGGAHRELEPTSKRWPTHASSATHSCAAYMYRNRGDGQWWIDEPSGAGVYVVLSDSPLPPTSGWKALPQGASPLPSLELVAVGE
jgi:hypothetical protein